jgi:hypothetical protein
MPQNGTTSPRDLNSGLGDLFKGVYHPKPVQPDIVVSRTHRQLSDQDLFVDSYLLLNTTLEDTSNLPHK